MNEAAALFALLLRAYERAPSPVWQLEDRVWASKAAARAEGEHASLDAFIARRAALGVERLRARDPSAERAIALTAWRPWIGHLVVAIALVAGTLGNALGSGASINLLAPPLLGLLVWNLAVYALLAAREAAQWSSSRHSAEPRAAKHAVISRLLAAVRGKVEAGPAARFLADWTARSLPLVGTRIGRVLHVAAIALAVGLLAGLYFRGLAFEYRAGWESTFLDAAQVRAVLGVVLGPAAALSGIGIPSAATLEAMRFPASAGVNAASWLHLYAITIALLVVLPRGALALRAWLIEQRLMRRFPLDLDDVYFQRLAGEVYGAPTRIRIAPYSLGISPRAVLGLQALLGQALRARADVEIAPATAYGEEDAVDATGFARGVALLMPAFALAATPEPENHGAFLRRLRAGARGSAALVVLIDESSFKRQFGADGARTKERRAAWHQLLDACDCNAVFVDLEEPNLVTAAAQLNDVLESPAAHA